ncbi:YslB family protein [Oceanobacillus timonensis]|uniref:YslB family protein n=1 Tax=Oceanobacillus timonensis TaxID=1926285 RepID=UPI0009BA4C76|nr:YslB family protein [Oceanobacillus timonensis]
MKVVSKNESNQKLDVNELEQLYSDGAGYDILRYIGLPELFGEEKETLLYFLGRNVARKFEFNSLEDVSSFFEKMGLGTLDLVKEKKNVKTFNLLSEAVVTRLKSNVETDFRLEAGIIAEALQQIEGVDCECLESIHRRLKQIEFTVYIQD